MTGQSLSQFKITAKLGEGGMGEVYRADLAQAQRKPPEILDIYDCVLCVNDYRRIHDADKHPAARDCLETVVDANADYADALA